MNARMYGVIRNVVSFVWFAVIISATDVSTGSASSSSSSTTNTTTTTTSATTSTPTSTRRTTTARRQPPPRVNVDGVGNIFGLRIDSLNVEQFLRIPYAKPPVGDLRFQNPVAYESTGNDIIDATKWGPSCNQVVDPGADRRQTDFGTAPGETNEDCLFLNIWKPANASTSNTKAVMVWIHGGGFYSGSSSIPNYNASVLASRGDVVVVSMNYRLGPLGFLSMNDDSARGNYGLLDQQLTLRWVHDHIAAFGGDPQRVTLFGQSAGGASVNYHLMSPGSQPLFRNAIMESTVATGPYMSMSNEDAVNNAKGLATRVDCKITASGRRQTVTNKDIVNCLREKDAATLAAEQWNVPVSGPPFQQRFSATVDGVFITDSPVNVLNTNAFQKKNVLMGVTSDEGSYFLLKMLPVNVAQSPTFVDVTSEQFNSLVTGMNSLNAAQQAVVGFEYTQPCATAASGESVSHFSALENILGDRVLKCPLIDVALSYANQSEQLFTGQTFSVYVYEFVHRDPLNNWPAWAGNGLHGDEVDYVFGQPFNVQFSANFTDDDRTLSDRIVTYWTNFAKTGDPNDGGDGAEASVETTWPKYGFQPTSRQVLMLNTESSLRTQTGLQDRQCDLWRSVIPQLTTSLPATSLGDRHVACTSWITAIVALLTYYTNFM